MQFDTSDIKAGFFGLSANLIAFFLGLLEIENIVDGASVAIVTLIITFYGNMLLRWLHSKKKDKQT